MATQTVIETVEGYISYPGRAICITNDGTIYVAYCTTSYTHVHVYRSTDQGATWVSFADISGYVSYKYAQMLTDSAGRVHLIYTARTGTSTYELIHRSYESATGWTAEHTMVSMVNAYMSASVMDVDDVIHTVYQDYISGFILRYTYSTDAGVNWTAGTTIDDGTTSALDVCLGIDTDSNLHACWKKRGNYGSGSANNTNVLYLKKNYGGAWESSEWATGYDSVSPYDQRPQSVVVNSVGEVLILYKHGSAVSDTHCAVRAVGGGWSQEVIISNDDVRSGDLVIDGTGRLYAICAADNNRDYVWSERTATDTWTAKTNITTDMGTSASYRIDSLYALFPFISGSTRTNVPATGFASILLSTTPAVEFYNNATFSVVSYPSDALARVTGLVHRYRPGHYSLEILFGDITTEWNIADYLYGSGTGAPSDIYDEYRFGAGYVSQIPRGYGYVSQPPVCPVGTVPKWTWTEGWICVPISEPAEPHYGAGYVSQPPAPFGVIQPEWAQGATPYELSGLFRTAEELRYGPNIGPIERHLQKAKAEEKAEQAFKGVTSAAGVGPSTAPPKCPTGQIPRFINGKWECVPYSPGTTAPGGYAR